MLIKNSWYVAANPQELAVGNILGRIILNTPLAIWRLPNGTVMAALDRCPHRATPLTMGRIVENTIRCGYHGAQFDQTGQCVAVPGQAVAPGKGCALKLYPVVETYGFVWVWMGDAPPSSLETALAPFAIGSNPDWHGGNGLFESLKANFKLVSDNLFDITHAEFIHPESFGGPETRYYRKMEPGHDYCDGKMTYEMGDRSITVRMRARNLGDDCGPFFRWMVATGLGVAENTHPIDQELEIIWAAPSFVFFRGTSSPNHDDAKRFTMIVLHAVTPESETSCHYFYRAVRDFAPGAELTESLMRNVAVIFQQDRGVFEMQQLRIGDGDLFDQAPVSFAGDIVQIRARRIIREMMMAESAPR
jgi:phenylpropionate dioxygenase-like ring-hydroxylating dioxygenase large terminal subunit